MLNYYLMLFCIEISCRFTYNLKPNNMNFSISTSTKYSKSDLLNSKAYSLYKVYEKFKKDNDFANEILAILETKESNEANNKAARYFLDEFSITELGMEKSLKEYNDFCRINNLN